MYSVPPTNQGADTGRTKTYVVDVDNPGAPKLAGTRYGFLWLDDDHIVTWGSSGSYIATVSSGATRRFFADSLWIAAVMDRRFLVYYDMRRSSAGWWKVEIEPTTADELLKQRGDVVMPSLRGSARKLSSGPSPYYILTTGVTDAGDMYQFAEEGRLRQISCVRGTETMLPTRFPGLTNSGSVDVSPDGKEILFVTPRLSSRLILLENVFR
jgi:hypothetical protein